MTEPTPDIEGVHIDADWKTEAAREKERLARKEKEARAGKPAAGAAPPAFLELVNLLAMQAAVGLGGMQGPGGERIPPNMDLARHHIDMLELLKEKTKGNLTDDEQKVLDTVLYELRMQFVHLTTPPPKDEAGIK